MFRISLSMFRVCLFGGLFSAILPLTYFITMPMDVVAETPLYGRGSDRGIATGVTAEIPQALTRAVELRRKTPREATRRLHRK